MKSRLLLIALIVMSMSVNVFSQGSTTEESPILPPVTHNIFYMGPLAGYNNVSHNADLATFADDQFCPFFSDGSGHGLYAGIFVDIPFGEIENSQHSVTIRGMINIMPGSFSQAGFKYPSYLEDPNNPGTYVSRISETEHTLDISYTLLSFDILYRFNFIDNFGVLVGPTFDIPMTSTVEQKFSLTQPGDVYFVKPENPNPNYRYEDNDRTIVVKDGDLEDSESFRFGIKVGLQYEIITGTIFDIIPGVYYNYGLTKVTSQEDWRLSALQAGVDVRIAVPSPF